MVERIGEQTLPRNSLFHEYSGMSLSVGTNTERYATTTSMGTTA